MRKIINLILLIVIIKFSYCNSKSEMEFDSEKWINWQESENELSLRWNMINDLIKKHDLIGLTVLEIKELLGQPNFETNFKIRYYLGSSGRGINTGELSLFIEEGKIIDFKITDG